MRPLFETTPLRVFDKFVQRGTAVFGTRHALVDVLATCPAARLDKAPQLDELISVVCSSVDTRA